MIENAVLDGQKKKGIRLKDADAAELIGGANQEWFMYTQLIMPILQDSQEAWQLYLENRPDDTQFSNPEEAVGASNIRTPVIAQAVDSVLAQQHITNFPDQENFFESQPRNDKAKLNKKLVESYLSQEMRKINFLQKALMDRKNLQLDGTSAVATPFKRKTERKAVYKFPNIMGIEIPIGKPRKTYVDAVVGEGTDYLPLRLEDWRIDPTVDDFENTPFLYKYYKDIDDIRDIEGYQNTDEVTTYQQAWDQSEYLKKQKLEYNGTLAFLAVGLEDNDGIGSHKALIMERWGDFYIGEKRYKNHVMVWANESILLYFGPNPYDDQKKPFIVSSYNPTPGTLYGKSCVKDSIPAAHALDNLYNSVIDIVNNCANPYFTYRSDDTTLTAYIDGEMVPIGPGKAIPVKDHDSLKERSMPLPNMDWLGNIMQDIREDIRESTGGVPYATGGTTEAQNDRTLGEVQILANGTSTRFMLLVGIYELEKLAPYIKRCWANAQQFASQPVYISDFDQVLSPNTLKMMEFDFEITGARSVMEQQKLQAARMNFAQNILPQLLANGYATTTGDVLEVNVAELAKDAAIDAKMPNVDDRLKVVSSQQQISETPDNPMAAQAASRQLTMGSGLNGPPSLQQAQSVRPPNPVAAA